MFLGFLGNKETFKQLFYTGDCVKNVSSKPKYNHHSLKRNKFNCSYIVTNTLQLLIIINYINNYVFGCVTET